ncbi:MAG: DUF6472 family protein [Lachnospiraceae bacterium]|jgi:hypothetical protein|nr:hypothetical protein [Lachnospiraceae bacterium]MCR5441134.1 DUF6472 family protein [Lachnospiraceae bacterium]
MFSCDTCVNYVYDEDDESYDCMVSMDEDDAYRISVNPHAECPYYRNDDEYAVVRHQM